MPLSDQSTRTALLTRTPSDDPLSHALTIIIPAYNEERGIRPVVEQVRDAMESFDYDFEIVIVDDGSNDTTAAQVIKGHGLRQVSPAPRNLLEYAPVRELNRGGGPTDITLVRKENGGRADALNAGLDLARHPYVCVTDADSILDPDALTVMMRPVQEDPDRVIAVGGTVRVACGSGSSSTSTACTASGTSPAAETAGAR
jgi:cellulose synthase/poly-beta-1,6-N-acetylglucosamine synthase-like glycosyltransferase